MKFSTETLFDAATEDEVFRFSLAVAEDVGLPTTTWRTGDPTLSLYRVLARRISALESVASQYARSAFLSTAEGAWLDVLAEEVYGVTRRGATRVVSSVTLRNESGGVYFFGAGDLILRSSITGATYRSTQDGSLTAVGETRVFAVVADDPGRAASVGADEIDEIISSFPGVIVIASTPGLAQDAEDDASLRARCYASLAVLSPAGAADAYRYVATTPELSGTSEVTRVFVSGNTSNGAVQVSVASPSGPVSPEAVSAVYDALMRRVVPLTSTLSVVAATSRNVAVTVTMSLVQNGSVTTDEAEIAIAEAIASFVDALPVGGISGSVDADLFTAVVVSVYGPALCAAVSVQVSVLGSPVSVIDLASSEIVTLENVDVNVSLV